MGLDIRIPLGLVFLIIGALLVLYGVLSWGSAIYHASMDWNINVIWGSCMMLFGVVMLAMAYSEANRVKRKR
jgi:steroid 5-alpha reductase family enzyme